MPDLRRRVQFVASVVDRIRDPVATEDETAASSFFCYLKYAFAIRRYNQLIDVAVQNTGSAVQETKTGVVKCACLTEVRIPSGIA